MKAEQADHPTIFPSTLKKKNLEVRLGWSSLVWPGVNLVSRQFSMHEGKIIVWSMAYSYIQWNLS